MESDEARGIRGTSKRRGRQEMTAVNCFVFAVVVTGSAFLTGFILALLFVNVVFWLADSNGEDKENQ